MQPTLLTPVSAEFSDVDLGDARLNRRLVQIAEAAGRAPGASIPEQAGSSAALEATYRFFGNARVTPEVVFDGHVQATVARAADASKVYVIHDTTEFRFGGDSPREGMGRINTDRQEGFLGHYSLCVSEQGEPLGSLGCYAWSRPALRRQRRSHTVSCSDPDRESLRWHDAAVLTGELLHGKAAAIHLMDREGDSYELFALLREYEQRFVIRLRADRRLEPGRTAPETPKLYESLHKSPLVFEREVTLSARPKPKGWRTTAVYPKRNRRLAELEVRAGARELFPSQSVAKHTPPSLELNFVEVKEPNPPDNEEPIVWRLVTTEPIDTAEQVAAVIDAYRQRWLIEEFFKALKTGCRYQQLQLESSRGLLIALAIESAVAWRLLLLRWAAQHRPDKPASSVVPGEQLKVLRAISKLDGNRPITSQATVRDVLLNVASLGGHIKNNGPPGWLTLRRGFDKLLTLHQGWDLARAAESAERCDQ